MKANQIKSCQKCLLLKTYEKHTKGSRADLIKKRPDVVLKTHACAAAKYKIIHHGLTLK